MITIDPEIANLCPALKPEEKAQLEANLVAEGCRDPLVLWGETLLDGHNRHEICHRLGLPYDSVVAVGVKTREDAINWVIANQLGRRNLNPEEASYLRGKRYNAEKGNPHRPSKRSENPTVTGRARDRLAAELGVHHSTISEDGAFAAAVDAIAVNVGPDAAREIRSGQAKVTKQAVKQVAKQPAAKQKAALDRAKQDRSSMRAKPKSEPKPMPDPKVRVVYDSDDQIAEQICTLCNRLAEVAQKVSPEGILPKIAGNARFANNADRTLAPASHFLDNLHQLWTQATKKNAAG